MGLTLTDALVFVVAVLLGAATIPLLIWLP